MLADKSYNFNVEAAHAAILECLKQYSTNSGGTAEFVVGLSGGIDSALVAAFAVEAFGKNRVHGFILPSSTTSEKSVELALELGRNLEIDVVGLPLGKIIDNYCSNFEKNLGCELSGLTTGNVAARMRMISLMTVSNEFGWKVLNTGNRTEAMLGYCTLFGDTVGEFSPIGDVFKTEVYQLAELVNMVSFSEQGARKIPAEIITRPATAELMCGQTDEAELGANYATIDRILWGRFVQRMTVEEFVNFGFNGGVVDSILSRASSNSFKARFFAPHPIVHPELN